MPKTSVSLGKLLAGLCLVLFLGAFPALGQSYYYGSNVIRYGTSAYGYSSYSGYSYPGYSYAGYARRSPYAARDAYDTSSRSSEEQAELSSSTPIRIWLSSGIGDFGGYRFYALGGRESHPTPTGSFTVKSKDEDFYSYKYKSPMPLSVFFTSQCAIHVGSLSVPSHGCIHVDRSTAEMLFSYAKPGKTKVVVYD